MEPVRKINIFGGYGFVGSAFCSETNNILIKNSREDLNVYGGEILYLISTVDNYNIHINPHLDVDTNIVTFLKVLENYKNFVEKETPNIHCFNFISSWFVYGKDSGFGKNSRGISETESCDPKGFYSITKRCAEQLLISYCETFGLNYRILRLGNVLGKDDTKVSKKKNALQYLIKEIKENRDIELYDNGQFYRDYIDVRDCARAIDLVLKQGRLNTIYNIGNGFPQTFKDLIEYAIKITGSNSKIFSIEQKKFHKIVQTSSSFFMDNTNLKYLGYSPKYTIYDTIHDLVR